MYIQTDLYIQKGKRKKILKKKREISHMPIRVQNDLPVKEILEQENIFVMDECVQHIRISVLSVSDC